MDAVDPTGLLQQNIAQLRAALEEGPARGAGREEAPGAEVVAAALPGSLASLFDQIGGVAEDVTRGPTASPEDELLIREAANRAIEAGLIDIERFQTEGLEQVRNVLAPARGLRPGDSPIVDRGGQIVREATRQAGQLISGVRGAEAQNLLQFPLQRRASDLSAVGLQVDALGGFQEFQRSLRDNAFRNRLLLGSALGDIALNVSQQGIGLATGIPANVSGTLASIAASQPQVSSTRAPFNVGTGLANIGAAAGGIGGLLQGISLVSSREFKERIAPLDIGPLLSRVKLLSCDQWRWRTGDGSTHCGPYAEEMKELFGIGDGRSFPIYDAIGVLFALIKALSKRVEHAAHYHQL